MYWYGLVAAHVTLCVVLIGLVLLQQGKGADLGATLGGGSNTLFGAGGATALVVRVTTGVAILFMVTSILLVRAYRYEARYGRVSDVLSGSSVAGTAPVGQAASGQSQASTNAPAQAVPAAPAPEAGK